MPRLPKKKRPTIKSLTEENKALSAKCEGLEGQCIAYHVIINGIASDLLSLATLESLDIVHVNDHVKIPNINVAIQNIKAIQNVQSKRIEEYESLLNDAKGVIAVMKDDNKFLEKDRDHLTGRVGIYRDELTQAKVDAFDFIINKKEF